jgi:hypothetical protein
LQDAVKEIDRKINIKNTIDKLKNDQKFYEDAKKKVSTSKSTAKKELADIEEKNKRTLKDLEYYMNFQKSPKETPEVLTDSRTQLVEKITELSRLTNMEDIRYLTEKGIEANNPQMDRSTITALYREIDDVKSQLEDLKKKVLNFTPPASAPSRLADSRIEKWKVYASPGRNVSGK